MNPVFIVLQLIFLEGILCIDNAAVLGNALHPVLGGQRTAALRVLGAAYLVRLACDNLGVAEPGESDAHLHAVVGRNSWNIVVTVELADLAFSLDNVVAAVALSSQLWVVMLGVAIGILLMRFAAGWSSYAAEREPVLKTAAYVLVFNIGLELPLEEFGLVHFPDWARLGISAGTLALAYAHLPPLCVFQPALNWLG
jgi:tellurite resistance protein TerC